MFEELAYNYVETDMEKTGIDVIMDACHCWRENAISRKSHVRETKHTKLSVLRQFQRNKRLFLRSMSLLDSNRSTGICKTMNALLMSTAATAHLQWANTSVKNRQTHREHWTRGTATREWPEK